MIISPRSRYFFPDISKYEPFLNPAEYVSAGIKFAIVRIGTGEKGEDPFFVKNAKKLIDVGITVMGYWWIDPTGDAIEQARTCKQIVVSSGLPIKYIWGDIERWWNDWAWHDLFTHGKVPFDQSKVFRSTFLNNYYFTCMAELANQFMDQVGIYTGQGFITSWCPQMADWLFSYRLWISQYPKEVKKGTFMTWEEFCASWLPTKDPNMKDMSKEFPLQLMGHQFTGDHVRLPGAYKDAQMTSKFATPLDVNVFQKDFCDALLDSGSNPSPLPSPGPGIIDPLFRAIVRTGAANIRNAPIGSAEVLRSELQGTILSIYRISTTGWGKVAPFQDEWVFMADLQKALRSRKGRRSRKELA
jgi:hypothetical protein